MIGRRTVLYSLAGAAGLVLVVGFLLFGTGLFSADESPGQTAERTASEQAASERESTGETVDSQETAYLQEIKRETADQKAAKAKEQAEQEAAEQEAAEQQAAEQEAEREWREVADRRAAEQRAAEERRAAEREASEQEAAQPAIPTSTALSLSVPSAGIQNDPVTNSVAESVLANGAGKLPSSAFPWQDGANTYIAGHVYGYPGTGSWQQFARVPNMSMGDQIFLTDSNGTTYEYRVSEMLTVDPTDVWVAQPTGQDMVSLQTCVGPGWSKRLVVRGTLVGTSQA